MNKIRQAFQDSLVILPGYLVLGIGFGALMIDKGFSLAQVLAMSAFIYAGSLQYVGVSLLSEGASLLTGFFMSVMVNIRHLFYGVSVLKKYQQLERNKLYTIFALTDETFSLVCSKDLAKEDENYYFWVSLFDHLYWIGGSLIGAVLSDLAAIDLKGIDFSMTALFIVIVLSQWEKQKDHRKVILSFVISIVSLLIFGSSRLLLPAMTGIVIMLFILRKKETDHA